MSLHIPAHGSPAQRLLLEKALPHLPMPQEIFLPLIHRGLERKEHFPGAVQRVAVGDRA